MHQVAPGSGKVGFPLQIEHSGTSEIVSFVFIVESAKDLRAFLRIGAHPHSLVATPVGAWVERGYKSSRFDVRRDLLDSAEFSLGTGQALFMSSWHFNLEALLELPFERIANGLGGVAGPAASFGVTSAGPFCRLRLGGSERWTVDQRHFIKPGDLPPPVTEPLAPN